MKALTIKIHTRVKALETKKENLNYTQDYSLLSDMPCMSTEELESLNEKCLKDFNGTVSFIILR